MREPTIAELQTYILSRSLADFVKGGWSVLHPTKPLVWNWHMDVVCAELEAQMAGPSGTTVNPITGSPIAWSQDVLINVPPGTSKSMLVSVFLPAWMWLRTPSWRAIYASATPFVALRDSGFCRDLIDSEWYQDVLATVCRLEKRKPWVWAADQNAKGHYKNSEQGFRLALSVGAKVTGGRADALFVDDPLDANDADSEVARLNATNWWDLAFGNRLASMEFGTRTVIMQRLHEDDLSGHLLRLGGVRHVAIPMEHDPALPFTYEGDPRRIPGLCEKLGIDPIVLHPARFPESVRTKERLRLREAGYAGQMQQHPVPASGNLYKREWWRFWRPDGQMPLERPKGCATPEQSPTQIIAFGNFRFDEIAMSVDANFKDRKDADPVAIWVVGRKGPNRYLLGRFRDPCGFLKTVAAIKRLREAWPRARRIWIEAKANGDAIIETLSQQITGVIAIPSEVSNSGKEGRSTLMEPVVQSGNWYLPEHAPWLDEVVAQFAVFPKGSHDDEVDAGSQLEAVWSMDGNGAFGRKMGKLTADSPAP